MSAAEELFDEVAFGDDETSNEIKESYEEATEGLGSILGKLVRLSRF